MNAKQKAKLDMYEAVISFCDKNATVFDSFVALKTSYASFKSTVNAIASTGQQKALILTGITTGKINARKALTRQAVTVAGQLFAFANANGMDTLKEQVNFSISYFNRLKDVDLPGVCRNILTAATDNVTALASYDVTEQTNLAFANMITAYEEIKSDPRNAISKRVMQRVSLKSLFGDADNFLKNEMDKMMARYVISNTDFFIEYESNRVIVDPATTFTQLKGTVTDKSNGNVIEDAIVSIADTDITVMSSVKGRFVIKPLAPGTYNVTISKKGFGTVTFADQVVKLGQITTVNGEMEEMLEEVKG